MKTIFVSSLKPFTIVEKPSERDLAYYQAVADPNILKSQRLLQQQLPQLQNVDFTEYKGKNIFDHPIFDDPQLLITWEHLVNCNLHHKKVDSFEDVAYLILFFNLCYTNPPKFEIQDIDLHFARSREEVREIGNNYPSEKLTAIFIPFNLSKTRVKQWIDENWDSVQDSVSELPDFKVNYIPKNLELGFEITNLRAEEKSFEEISEIMFERYPDDNRLADYGHVKTLYHRYQEYIPQAFISALAAKFLKRNTK